MQICGYKRLRTVRHVGSEATSAGVDLIWGVSGALPYRAGPFKAAVMIAPSGNPLSTSAARRVVALLMCPYFNINSIYCVETALKTLKCSISCARLYVLCCFVATKSHKMCNSGVLF